MDKDILVKGNKIYSPDTCLLVPQRINMLFLHHRPNKYGLPEGIRMTDKGKYTSSYEGRSLGMYETLSEAILIHNIERKKAIQKVANEYKNIIPSKVYKALMEYQIV